MTWVVVSGALANKPGNGGNAWTRLSWALGFKQLGFQVCFVEQIAPSACVDSAGQRVPLDQSINQAYFREVTQQFGISHAVLMCGNDAEHAYGMTRSELHDMVDNADALFNISGHLQGTLRRRFRRSIFFDDDPGFTQFWWAAGNAGARLEGHDHWFTIGENVGSSGCTIPLDGIPWRTTRPPVTLSDWPVRDTLSEARFTTVGTWRGPYGPVHYQDRTYGLKVHEFRKFLELPTRVPQDFELALDIDPGETRDLTDLTNNGWHLVDPRTVARSPGEFRQYVQTSGAEFSAAQGMYVGTHSGWFSDRSVRYLASGKPVLVQDTGFSRNYPVGEGLLAFRTLDEAVAGVDRITRDYELHARAARSLAEEYFDANRVVGRLSDEVGLVQ